MNHGEAVFDDAPKAVFAHYKELEAMGLAAPQITYIMHALKEHGLHVDVTATTVDEAKGCRCHNGGEAISFRQSKKMPKQKP